MSKLLNRLAAHQPMTIFVGVLILGVDWVSRNIRANNDNNQLLADIAFSFLVTALIWLWFDSEPKKKAP